MPCLISALNMSRKSHLKIDGEEFVWEEEKSTEAEQFKFNFLSDDDAWMNRARWKQTPSTFKISQISSAIINGFQRKTLRNIIQGQIWHRDCGKGNYSLACQPSITEPSNKIIRFFPFPPTRLIIIADRHSAIPAGIKSHK